MSIEHLLSGLGLWVATYLLHSTLLLAATWLLTRLPRLGAPQVAETLWRTALYGAVFTASLHASFGAPVWRAEVPLGETTRQASPEPATAEASTPLAISFEVPLAAPVDPPEAAAIGAPPTESTGLQSWWHPAWLLLLWPLGVALGVWRRRRRRRRLRRSLRTRTTLEDPRVRQIVADLAAEAGVARHIRLTTSTTLSSPVAFGTRHPEICLPARARDALEPALLEAMLAHEVAHVARHDAAWLRAYRVTTTLLFFQPLNLLAVRNLHDTAEMLCDAWAAREQGRRVALARCLTAVADWILERPAPLGISAMALRPSLLGRRVELLVAGETSDRTRGRGTALIAALPLLVVLALAPGLKGASSPNGESVSDTDSSFGVLDGELGALAVEMEELQTLLIDAGHPELADRLEHRRRSLTLERDRLREHVVEPLSDSREREEK